MHCFKDYLPVRSLLQKSFILPVSFQDIPLPVEEKPEKQEYAVATYLKKHCPVKRTKFLNHQVNYFYGKSFSRLGKADGFVM